MAGDHLRRQLPLVTPARTRLAEAGRRLRHPGFQASTPEEVEPAIRAAQAVDGPALVWFEIAETQNVFPMMPAGKGLSDLIETWEGRANAMAAMMPLAAPR